MKCHKLAGSYQGLFQLQTFCTHHIQKAEIQAEDCLDFKRMVQKCSTSLEDIGRSKEVCVEAKWPRLSQATDHGGAACGVRHKAFLGGFLVPTQGSNMFQLSLVLSRPCVPGMCSLFESPTSSEWHAFCMARKHWAAVLWGCNSMGISHDLDPFSSFWPFNHAPFGCFAHADAHWFQFEIRTGSRKYQMPPQKCIKHEQWANLVKSLFVLNVSVRVSALSARNCKSSSESCFLHSSSWLSRFRRHKHRVNTGRAIGFHMMSCKSCSDPCQFLLIIKLLMVSR